MEPILCKATALNMQQNFRNTTKTITDCNKNIYLRSSFLNVTSLINHTNRLRFFLNFCFPLCVLVSTGLSWYEEKEVMATVAYKLRNVRLAIELRDSVQQGIYFLGLSMQFWFVTCMLSWNTVNRRLEFLLILICYDNTIKWSILQYIYFALGVIVNLTTASCNILQSKIK